MSRTHSIHAAAAALGLALLAGCTSTTGDVESAADAPTAAGARATLYSPSGVAMGSAMVEPISGGLRLTVNGMALPPGPHGAHIHTTGKCDAPDFSTAGPHWNPTAMQHGTMNPAGPHGGDLPNLLIGTDGTGSISIDLPGTMLTGGTNPLLDADGAALVIHAAADDLKTDPSGNSGGRIACGVLAAG